MNTIYIILLIALFAVIILPFLAQFFLDMTSYHDIYTHKKDCNCTSCDDKEFHDSKKK